MTASTNILLAGDVMTGRGVDQILPAPSRPELVESYVRDARRYVELAEQQHGPVPRRVDMDYVWGDALEHFRREAVDIRLVNLETSITASDDYWPGKTVHYRMSPENAPVLTAPRIDVCSLANNHVLDWGYDGLAETLRVLDGLSIHHAGAGATLDGAARPAALDAGGRRLLVFSACFEDAGIPGTWRATSERAGVHLLYGFDEHTVELFADLVERHRRAGDIVVASLHWGSNWGWDIPDRHVHFARGLVDIAGVDVVHGHSSHHVRGLEVYRGRLILYGCGDLLTDYEGIGGRQDFRPELSLVYIASIDGQSGRLEGMTMWPMCLRNMQLHRASSQQTKWLANHLRPPPSATRLRVDIEDDGSLRLVPPAAD